ncbi:MAG: chromate transporter [Eubacteriales bacterium]|nr:chromate transporter [Eubacteriales bacterium]
MNLYLDLIITFMKIGLFMFGGGYSMLPLLQREIVEKRKWASEEEVLDYYAIGQSTPGIISVNTATFIGYKLKGVSGGIIVTFAIVTPSIIIILLIASVFDQFMELGFFQHAFAGIRVAVCALVTFSVYKLAKAGAINVLTTVWMVITFIAIAFLKISPVIIVVSSFILGNIAKLIEGKIKEKKGGTKS